MIQHIRRCPLPGGRGHRKAEQSGGGLDLGNRLLQVGVHKSRRAGDVMGAFQICPLSAAQRPGPPGLRLVALRIVLGQVEGKESDLDLTVRVTICVEHEVASLIRRVLAVPLVVRVLAELVDRLAHDLAGDS